MTQQQLMAPWPSYWGPDGWTQDRKRAHKYPTVDRARQVARGVLGRVCVAGPQVLVYRPEGA